MKKILIAILLSIFASFVLADVAIYTFVDSTNNKAYQLLTHNGNQPPTWALGWSPGTEVSAVCYTNLSTSNNVRCVYRSGGTNLEPFQRYEFRINQTISSIDWIQVKIEQQNKSNAAGEDCANAIANLSSRAWGRFNATDTQVTTNIDVPNTKNFTSGFSDLINSSNAKLTIMSSSNLMDSNEGCNIDYVEVMVGHDSTPPQWSDQSQNNSNPEVGEQVKLSVNWSDNGALSSAILSTNETGNWVNWTGVYNSPISLTGKQAWSNFTWQNLSTTEGTVVGWRVWANDAKNNWNVTSIMTFTVKKPTALINSVTLNSPSSDPSLDIGSTFSMNCTPNTNNRPGINMTFEYNYTGQSSFVDIPTSGGGLTLDIQNPIVNVTNNAMYNKTITGNTADTYYVRCRAYNATSNVISSTQIVTVKKPVSLINSVTLNAPTSDLSIPEDYQFDMNCTPNTNNKPGINITFEYNTTTAGWIPLPTSGTENLTINIPNPNVDVSNNTMYNHTVTAQTNGTYWIRCRAYNSTTSVNSTTRKIDVRKIILSINQTYPSYLIYNPTNPLPVEHGTTFEINSTVRCESQAPSGSCGNIYCSVRYNSTGTSASTLISTTTGATPFYIVGGAYQEMIPTYAENTMDGDVTALVNVSDSVYALELCAGDKCYTPYIYIYFNTSKTYQNVTVEGMAKGSMPVECWNGSAWVSLRFSLPLMSKGNVTGPIDNCSNSNGNYTFRARGFDSPVTGGAIIDIDYAVLSTSGSAINPKPCGVMNVGQECNLTWVVNATGADDTLWAIDTNCTSSSPKISENSTTDAYVKIKPITKLFVDKPSYKSCGIVYYNIRTYDLSDNPIDSNMTVRIIDPLGIIKNTFNASTSSGVYLGTYLLEPNAALGDWIIKVSTCSISKKYFEVGQGNSELWKIDMNSPTKVKFSPGESISINLVVYNLKGERTSNLLPSSSLTVSLDGNDITSTCSDLGDGAYRCATSAPVPSGAHYLNINARAIGGTINVTNSKSFFVE